jgi:hypothetical protein
MYARLMRHWIASDPAAHSVLTAMLADRLELGLAEPRELAAPLDVRPVVAVGLPIKNEKVAKARALAVADALNAAGLTEGVCEYWGIDAAGAVSALW